MVLLPHARREPECRDGFQQRIEGPAERAGLLAGHDRDRAILAQTLEGRPGFRRRAAPLLLGRDHVGDLVAQARVPLRPFDRRQPVLGPCRVARVEGRERFERVRVIAGKAADPRVAPDVDGDPARAGSLG